MQRSLQPIVEQTLLFHEDMAELWTDLPEPTSHRSLAVLGFCLIVRQHVGSQLLLAQAGFDVPATTLVRPAYEALATKRGQRTFPAIEPLWDEMPDPTGLRPLAVQEKYVSESPFLYCDGSEVSAPFSLESN